MSHSFANNYVHAVFSTKGRRDLIPPEFEAQMYSFIAETARNEKIPFVAGGGMPNHSHLVFVLPATITLSLAIKIFKANSSRFMGEQGISFQWQEGYAAFSVSPTTLDVVTRYVRMQRKHHRKMTFEQEFMAMLKKAGTTYDMKYVFG